MLLLYMILALIIGFAVGMGIGKQSADLMTIRTSNFNNTISEKLVFVPGTSPQEYEAGVVKQNERLATMTVCDVLCPPGNSVCYGYMKTPENAVEKANWNTFIEFKPAKPIMPTTPANPQ